jgi:hypothetical protein
MQGYRLCDLMVTVPGCEPRGPGFDTRHYQIFCVAVNLEWSPLSLVRLLERKVTAPVYKTEIKDLEGSAELTKRYPSICKSWH